jgi:hypothetical protein
MTKRTAHRERIVRLWLWVNGGLLLVVGTGIIVMSLRQLAPIDALIGLPLAALGAVICWRAIVGYKRPEDEPGLKLSDYQAKGYASPTDDPPRH